MSSPLLNNCKLNFKVNIISARCFLNSTFGIGIGIIGLIYLGVSMVFGIDIKLITILISSSILIIPASQCMCKLAPLNYFSPGKLQVNLHSGGVGGTAARGQIYMGIPIGVVEIHLRAANPPPPPPPLSPLLRHCK